MNKAIENNNKCGKIDFVCVCKNYDELDEEQFHTCTKWLLCVCHKVLLHKIIQAVIDRVVECNRALGGGIDGVSPILTRIKL